MIYKRLMYIVFFIVLLFLVNCDNSIKKQSKNYKYSNIKVLPDHAIPDTNTAVKIAEAIWIAKYGLDVLRQRPYEIILEKEKDTVWHIEGTAYFSEDSNMISVGGVAYLSIRSRDCKIIELYHSY